MTKSVDNVAVALLLERARRIAEKKRKKKKKKKKREENQAQQNVGEAFADLAAQLRNVSTFMAARDI